MWTDGTSIKRFSTIFGSARHGVGTVMSKSKEMCKQAFSGKLKKGEKTSPQRNRLLAIKWGIIRDVLLLTSAHEDVLVEAPTWGHIIK
jgi:hypothetical protein